MKSRHVLWVQASALSMTLLAGVSAWAQDPVPNYVNPINVPAENTSVIPVGTIANATVQTLFKPGAPRSAQGSTGQSGSMGPSIWSLQVPRARGRINYSLRNEMRKGSDFQLFNSHEDGLIGDAELKTIVARATQLQAFTAVRGGAISPEFALNQSMAQFVLSRVLDHEAAKRRVPRHVTDDRANYVMRAILTQNAISKGKLARLSDERARLVGAPLDKNGRPEATYESAILFSNAQMYAWLRETVAENRARFNIDWKFEKAGLGIERQHLLRSRGEVAWPKVQLTFESMPATFDEFREQIRVRLQPTQDALLRNALWRQLVQERTNMSIESLSAVSSDQVQAIYDTLKSTFQVENTRAEVLEVRAAGERAEAFKLRFMTLLDERQEALTQELFKNPSVSVTAEISDSASAELRAKIVELRRQVPGEVVARVKTEMATDLAAGRLKLTEGVRTLQHRAGEEVDASKGLEASELAAVMNPAFAIMSFFPRMDAQDTDGSTLIVLLRMQENSDPTFLAKSDPRVMQVLKAKAKSRVVGKVFRRLAWSLFNENRVELFGESCRAPECALASMNLRSSAVDWADALFPETLYPEFQPKQERNADGSLKPAPRVVSSLSQEDRFGQVFSISLEPFTAALEL